ncbi:sodium-coupled monocarboxylate transporter 1-like [Culicoides brevitarsis]|uniref:sodium-coupled monocarboxylate transporter 1-like n=1 Tax=Culicoides brevitarsis TaxID=469753 RepID=UPI00307C24CE
MDIAGVSESLKRFGWPDYLVFILMLALCSAIGVFFGWQDHVKHKKMRGRKVRRGSEALEYLVGGRKMKVFPVAMSLVASLISGIGLLGTSTEIYLYGTQYCFILIGVVLMGLVLHFFYLPVYHELKLTSLYEYLSRRFDNRIRLFGSLVFVLSTVVKMPIMIYVPALSFSAVTGVNIHITTPVVCAITVFYTSVGGIKAVVWTDVIQSVVMIFALIMVAVKATFAVGGLGTVLQINYDSGRIEPPIWDINPTIRSTIWTTVIGGWVFHCAINGICQSMVQRYVSLPTLRDARKAVWIFVAGVFVLLGLSMYNGLLLYAIYHDCDPLTTGLVKKKDQLVPLLVMQILGDYPGLAGCFIAGVFSASLSSLSTGLNSITAVILEDFIKPYRKSALSEKATAIIMKSTVIVLGTLSTGMVFIVEKLGPVLQLAITFAGVTYGPLLGIFTIGFVMPYIDSTETIIGAGFGLLCSTLIVYFTQMDVASGRLVFPEKPTSVENCTYAFDNSTLLTKSFDDIETPEAKFYHVSYLYYSLIGTTVTIVVANLCALIFGKRDVENVDPALLSPIVRKFFMKEKMEMKEYLKVETNDMIKRSESM